MWDTSTRLLTKAERATSVMSTTTAGAKTSICSVGKGSLKHISVDLKIWTNKGGAKTSICSAGKALVDTNFSF